MPPEAPVAVRVDLPGEAASLLFLVAAGRDEPIDEHQDGQEFSGVRDTRTGDPLCVSGRSSFGSSDQRYSNVWGFVPPDVEEIELLGRTTVVVPVAQYEFADVGWDGEA